MKRSCARFCRILYIWRPFVRTRVCYSNRFIVVSPPTSSNDFISPLSSGRFEKGLKYFELISHPFHTYQCLKSIATLSLFQRFSSVGLQQLQLRQNRYQSQYATWQNPTGPLIQPKLAGFEGYLETWRTWCTGASKSRSFLQLNVSGLRHLRAMTHLKSPK